MKKTMVFQDKNCAKWFPIWMILASLAGCIELEISAPGFIDLMNDFRVSGAEIEHTVTFNLLGLCFGALFYGPLSERWGRRPVLLLGNALLTLSAVWCVLASSLKELWLIRFFQGIGAAASAVLVSVIIADVYDFLKAARLYGVLNAVFTVCMALSPLLGAAMVAHWGWRSTYAAVAIIGGISWGVLYRWLPETHTDRKKQGASEIISSYATLLKHPIFLCSAASPSLLYGCYLGFVALAPFLYLQALKVNFFYYSLCQASIILVFALASAWVNKVLNRYGSLRLLYVSGGCMVLGNALMYVAHTALALTCAMSFISVGFALMYPMVFAFSMEIFPEAKGEASSVLMFGRYLLCALAVGLSAAYYDGTLLRCAEMVTMVVIPVGVMMGAVLKSKEWHTVNAAKNP